MKEFWTVFLQNKYGELRVYTFGHNPIADYRDHPDYIGYVKNTVNLERLDK